MRNEALDTSVYTLAATHLVRLSRIRWKDEKIEVILEEVTAQKETPRQLVKKALSQRQMRKKANGIKVYL